MVSPESALLNVFWELDANKAIIEHLHKMFFFVPIIYNICTYVRIFALA